MFEGNVPFPNSVSKAAERWPASGDNQTGAVQAARRLQVGRVVFLFIVLPRPTSGHRTFKNTFNQKHL